MLSILFFFSFSFSYSQSEENIKETSRKFWEAVDKVANEDVIKNGVTLIKYFEENNAFLDSSYIEIRIYTGLSFSNQGEFEKSLELNLATLELLELSWGSDHMYYSATLNNIASNYSSLGNYIKSLEYNFKTLEIVRNTLGNESPYYAICLNNIACNYADLGDYNKSLEYNYSALEIRKQTLGKKHPDYGTSLNNIASNYADLGNYQKSLEFNLLALEITKKTNGRNHSYYATSLNNIACNYSDIGDFNKSLKYNLMALKIRKKTLGSDHPDYALSIKNIASNYSDLGDYKNSLEFNLEALMIIEKSLGTEHTYYSSILNNIANNYSDLGDHIISLEYRSKALEIDEKTLGTEHPEYATSLNEIALAYSNLGYYNKSLELNLQALEILDKTLGKEHPYYATSLNNIALNYSYLGDDIKSLEYNTKSLEITEKTLGTEHPYYAISLNNIAANYSDLGNYLKSLEYNSKALEIIEKYLGKEHPNYATSLNNIALNYSHLGDDIKSLEYNTKSLEITEKTLGTEHPDYAISLHNIARNYSDLGDYQKSLDYELEALNISEKVFGSDNSFFVAYIALDYFSIKEFSLCSNYLEKGYKMQEKSFSKNKFGLTESSLITFKKDLETLFQLNSAILLYDKNYSQFLNRSWINLNGLIGTNNKLIEKNIIESTDSTQIELFRELRLAKINLSKCYEMTLQEQKESSLDQDKLEKKISLLERDLSKRSKLFAEANRYFYTKEVSFSLKENEILIDFARVPYYNLQNNQWTDSIFYIAFITNSKDSIIDYVLMKNGADLDDQTFSDYKLEISDKSNTSNLKNEIFYNSFWKPIAEKIGDAKTVYVSLGGVYNNINLNTLYNPKTGKYLIEEKDIRIVNSARDFVLSKEREKKQYTSTTSSLYGFPNFNGNTTTSFDTTDYLAATRDLNQMWLDSLTRGGMKASALPATKIEVEQIAGTFQKNGWNVSTYTGENAAETNIKREISPRVLHIATHGYFFEDIPLDTVDNRFLGMERNRVAQDPMLRSGLLFTGANRTLQGDEPKGENGLLSAAEASLLDLRETELVVLSACETGKGEVKNSEGVYGLRKAFADAGANNIIMSLWKVDDKVTQEFMTRFYEIWLNEKTSIREAFNRTQLEIKAKYPQPYYWGAFILVGE